MFEGKIESNSVYCKYAKYLKVGEKSGGIKNFPTKERDVFRIYQNKPIPTVVRRSIGQLIHYSEKRPLSVLELGICSSFPKNYKWRKSIINIISNAVPPKMMYHIAKTIKDKILNGVK